MIDEPNVILPLATSVNERGVAGYTHAVTNSEDQVKKNCFYELSNNPMTGKGTLTLSKRPGVTVDSNTYGSLSSQVPYLIITYPTTSAFGPYSNLPKVFYKLGNDLRVSSDLADKTIFSSSAGASSYFPRFIDTTKISGVDNPVFQAQRIDLAAPQQRTFYAASIANWTEISDGDFTALFQRGKMEHIDGFAFQMDKDNKIFNSDTNSLANWTASSFITKGIQQDYAQGLARFKNQLLAFGDETVEIFYNAGNTSGSPLGRVTQLTDHVGLVPTTFADGVGGGTHYYCATSNGMYFVGRRAGSVSSVGLFHYNGQSFEKVSTPYIDKILGEETESIAGAYSYYSINEIGFSGQQGIAICLSAPSATTQRSLVFFPDWKEWFIWTSDVFSPVNSSDFFLGSGAHPNKAYSFTHSDNWQDDGTSYQWLTQFQMPSNPGGKRMLMYGVDADTDTSANTITVEVSDNDCASFYALQSIDLTRDRKMNFRGGTYRKRHIRLSATDARPKRIHNWLARVE